MYIPEFTINILSFIGFALGMIYVGMFIVLTVVESVCDIHSKRYIAVRTIYRIFWVLSIVWNIAVLIVC